MELQSKSGSDYPRIGFESICPALINQQHTEAEKKGMPRAEIELAFMGATKNDGVRGLKGALSRGQFCEIILRLVV